MNIRDKLIQIVGAERFSDDKTVLYCYSRDVSLAKGVPDREDYLLRRLRKWLAGLKK